MQFKIFELVKKIFDSGEWQRVYKTIVIPIPKKSNAVECAHFRTISLISCMSKIILNIKKTNRNTNRKKSIEDSQFSYRQNMSTQDAIETLMFMAENA